MNFLLHHAFASTETRSEVAGVGAMLPDLWRMAHPRVRARGPRRRAETTSELEALQLGIDHHLAIDAWFHRSEVFVEGERRLAESFRALGVPKLALFAHAAWELCLDGALVRASCPLESIARGWALAADAIDEVAEPHFSSSFTADDRVRFHARMRRLRDGLLESAWVRSYASAEGLVELVEAIRTRRLGLEPLGRDPRHALEAIFVDSAPRADRALARLVEARADWSSVVEG